MADPKPTYADYGFVAAFLKAHPGVKSLVDKAIKQKWTPQRLEAAIKTTTWWKSRTESQRQYDLMKYDNPAELKNKVATMRSSIVSAAAKMGATLTGDQLSKLADKFVMNGSSPAEVQLALSGYIKTADAGAAQEGSAGVTMDALRQGAQAYGITLSDATLLSYTRNIEGGKMDLQGYQDTMREKAKVLYGSVADDLDRGLTVKDIVDPYLQMATKELGLNPSEIDLTDTKWTRALSGANGAMSADEWMTTLRTDSRYGWDKSMTARQQAYDLGTSIRKMFQGA